MAAKISFFPLFMHIPKTAGTTLHFVLRRQYRKKLQTFYTKEALKSPRLLPKTVAAIGHFRHNFYKRLPEINYAYATFLRHPTAHVFSHYHFIKSNKNGNHAAFAHFTLHDFVSHPFGNNFQTRSISGIDDITHREAEVLEIAKHNLSRFFFVGITEEFDAGLLTLQKKLGWGKQPYYLRGTVQAYSAIITEDESNIILKSNALDLALYEFAQTLWLQQKTAASISERQVAKFALRNHWYGMLAAKWSAIKPRVPE